MIGRALPVLMFHSVAPAGALAPHGWLERLSVPTETFEAMLEDWRRREVQTLGSDDLRAFLDGERTPPRRAVVLTFDDGYLDNWVAVAPLLERYGQRGIVFVSTDFIDPRPLRRPTLAAPEAPTVWKGYVSVSELVGLAASGTLEIGSHAATHTWEFTSPEIVDFYGPHWNIAHPRCRYRFLWLNAHREEKPFALERLHREAVPWGTPVYRFAPALVARRYLPDPGLSAALIARVAGEGGEAFFRRPDGLAVLRRQAEDYRARHGERGCMETEEERQERLREEVLGSRLRLEEITGRPVRFFSPPQGGADEQTLALARASGYDLVTAPSAGRVRLNHAGAGRGWVHRCGSGFDLFGRDRSIPVALRSQRLVLARASGGAFAGLVTRSVGLLRRLLPGE